MKHRGWAIKTARDGDCSGRREFIAVRFILKFEGEKRREEEEDVVMVSNRWGGGCC